LPSLGAKLIIDSVIEAQKVTWHNTDGLPGYIYLNIHKDDMKWFGSTRYAALAVNKLGRYSPILGAKLSRVIQPEAQKVTWHNTDGLPGPVSTSSYQSISQSIIRKR
jgi:hypothetical protein